jgi:pheromone shutdown-related protein TraB
MIKIIGTSHVAKESIRKVRQAFKEPPDIVAVELDPGRAYALRNKIKRPKNFTLLRTLGMAGFLFYITAEFIQKKLGKVLNLEPGAEMLAAIKQAEFHEIPVALIDRDIQITLKRFSRHFKKREILRMIWDSLTKFKLGKIDLNKTPSQELVEFVIEHTKKRYPSLYKILIDERDKHMAKRISLIKKKNPDKNILAVVGAGHVPGIKKYLNTNFK